jgi:hypothetical protein
LRDRPGAATKNRVRRGRRPQHTGWDNKGGCASPSPRALPSTRLPGTKPAREGRGCTCPRVHRVCLSSHRTYPSTSIRIRDELCKACIRARFRTRETSGADSQGASPGPRLHVRRHGRRQRRAFRLRLHDLRRASVALPHQSAWPRLRPRMHTPTRTQQGEDFDWRLAWSERAPSQQEPCRVESRAVSTRHDTALCQFGPFTMPWALCDQSGPKSGGGIRYFVAAS